MNTFRGGFSLAPLLVLLGLVVAIPGSVYLARQQQGGTIQAANQVVHFRFTSDSQRLPPNQNVRLVLDSGSQNVGLVRATIQFDQTKIHLVSEINTATALKTVIQKTTMAEANSSGKATVVLGVSAQDKANAPMGTFELASFQITSNTVDVNANTMLTIDLAGSEVTNTVSQKLKVEVEPISFLLNQPRSMARVVVTPTVVVVPTTSPELPAQVSDDGVGNFVIGPMIDSLNANYMNGLRVKTGSEPMQVLGAYVAVTNIVSAPNNTFGMAIFADQNGKPGSLIASSPTQTLDTAAEWQKVTMSAVLSPNTYYWLVYNSNGKTASDNALKYLPGKNGIGVYSVLPQAFGSGWPASFGTGVLTGNNFSMYLSSESSTKPNGVLGFSTLPVETTANTIGNSSVGELTDTSNSGYINGSRFMNTSAGTTKSISVYVDEVDTSDMNKNFQLAIYSNTAANRPGNLLATTQVGVLTPHSWNTLPIHTNLSEKTQYWLLYNTNGQSPAVNDMKYSATGVGIYTAKGMEFGTFPANLNSVELVNNKNNYSMFVTLSESY